jgi:hypothetical protein
VFFVRDYLRRIGPSPNKVLPSSLADWHQKEEIIKLGECDLQGGNGDEVQACGSTKRCAKGPEPRLVFHVGCFVKEGEDGVFF